MKLVHATRIQSRHENVGPRRYDLLKYETPRLTTPDTAPGQYLSLYPWISGIQRTAFKICI